MTFHRALVTGADGFIGRHLVRRLRTEGTAVVGLGRRPASASLAACGVRWVRGDVRDRGAVAAAATGCEAVFHLAAKVHALSARAQDDAAYEDVNVHGTTRVLAAAADAGVKRFVLFSSVKAMGEDGEGECDESTLPTPRTPYGRSKLEAERTALDTGRRLGLHVACLRLPLVYGPGQRGNLARLLWALDHHLFPPLPELGNRRSIVHVENVVSAALLAAASAAADQQCYLVTDARAYSTRELVDTLRRALGRRPPRWEIPFPALRAMARVGDVVGRFIGRRLPLDSTALAKLTRSAVYRSDKIARELGYRPGRGLDDSVVELVRWYRKGRA